MRPLAALAAMAAVALPGCDLDGPEPVTRGVVIEQRFIPAHDEDKQVPVFTTMCWPSGSSISCRTTVSGYRTETEHHPNRWEVNLLSCKYGGDEPCRTGWNEVRHGDYLEIKTGDIWPRWWLKEDR